MAELVIPIPDEMKQRCAELAAERNWSAAQVDDFYRGWARVRLGGLQGMCDVIREASEASLSAPPPTPNPAALARQEEEKA